ncbi:MAG: S-layer homology domain-containing protein [Synergistetes bacterium]|nr:S-layer homology domain-containing protein [Synergistota bacterium]
MRRYAVIAALVAVLALAVPALATNPFVDVPLNHWAYDAVAKLAADGIVQGYPDGTFQGSKPITRYEFAVAVARALAKIDKEKASKEDLALLKKLVVEFQDELNALGVKVDKIDKRLETVEKNLNGFQFAGELRVDFYWNNGDYYDNQTTPNYQDASISRARLHISKQVDDNVSIYFRIDDDDVFSKAYATIKFPWDITMTIGRFCPDWEGELGLYADNDAILTDRTYNPVIYFTKKAGAVDAVAYYAYTDDDELSEYGGRLDFHFNDKIRVGVFYMGWTTQPGNNLDPSVYGADFTVNFSEGFKIYGQYMSEDLGGTVTVNNTAVDDATIYKFGASVDQSVIGFTSFTVEYLHMDQGAFFANQPFAYIEAQEFLRTDGNSPVLTGYLIDDVDAVLVMLTQQWSDKVSTTERYYSFDYSNTLNDLTAFAFTFKYQYTPSTYFEFAYENVDWDEGSAQQDESRIRFRTYISF